MAWNPFDEISRMHEEMDKIFNRIFRSYRPLLETGKEKGKSLAKYLDYRIPTADVRETPDSVIVSFEVPGADKKDIDLNVTENRVEVKVEKKAEKEVKRKGLYSYEARSNQFYRALPLPTEVIPDKAQATYKDGLLKVEIPKVKKIGQRKKRVEIK
jgi:HSP20 family protein